MAHDFDRGRVLVSPIIGNWEFAISIFFGQQNAGRRTVGFRDYPELVTRAGTVGAQELEAVTLALTS